MSKTLFQRIIDREIPATIEFEDDEIIAIQDIAPSARVHILIIPKRPIASVNELTDADAALIGRVHIVARDLAAKHGIESSGYRVVSNCNADAGQTVFHLHFHLLGGEPLGRMNSRASSHQGGSTMSGTLREAGILLLLAIGLAAGFNMMNPKRIDWIKPVYERVQASDAELQKLLGDNTTPPAVNTAVAPHDVAATSAPTTVTTVTTITTQQKTVQPAIEPQQQPAAPPAFVAEPGVTREIKLDAFKKLLGRPSTYLIDARIPEKYAEGHVQGAVNVDGNTVETNIPQILTIPKERIIVIYCDGGHCELSHRVADVLSRFGYGPILIFTGGWAEWTAQGK